MEHLEIVLLGFSVVYMRDENRDPSWKYNAPRQLPKDLFLLNSKSNSTAEDFPEQRKANPDFHFEDFLTLDAVLRRAANYCNMLQNFQRLSKHQLDLSIKQ